MSKYFSRLILSAISFVLISCLLTTHVLASTSSTNLQYKAASTKIKINKNKLNSFIINAENVWEKISYNVGPSIEISGNYYGLLKYPYNTKDRILKEFKKYWTPSIATKMYYNLHPKIFKGKLYLEIGELGDSARVDKNDTISYSYYKNNIIKVKITYKEDGHKNQYIYSTVEVSKSSFKILSRSTNDDLGFIYK